MIESFLSRLNKVRPTGRDSWTACCPAHEDKNPSLSIRHTDDGRILFNCFAGCSAESIIHSIGLDWNDIEPNRPIAHALKPIRPRIYATDALALLSMESKIVMVAAFRVRKGEVLNETDMKRLELAISRINQAAELANVKS